MVKKYIKKKSKVKKVSKKKVSKNKKGGNIDNKKNTVSLSEAVQILRTYYQYKFQ